MIKEEKLAKGQKLARTAFFLEAVLAGSKALVGWFSGSLVLISDAIHSLSDLLSIFTSWFGLKIAQREPDEQFPYGYYKAESLGTLIIAVLILYAAWEMFSQGYSLLFNFSSIRWPLLALGVSLFDALILFFFGGYEIKVGQTIGAESLIAMGKENRTHLFSSLAVFTGILAAYFKIPYLETMITFLISFLILRIGLQAFKDSVFALMDVSPGEKVEAKVIKSINSVPGVEEGFDLRLRKAGPFLFGETKVGLRKSVSVKQAHEIAGRVEERVKKVVPEVDSLSLQVAPFKSNWRHLVMPVSEKKGLSSRLAPRLARAPYFLFVNLKGNKIKGHYFLGNPHRKKKIRAGLAVAKMLAEQKSDLLISQEIGEITFFALRDYLFDLYQAKGKTARAVIDYFLKDQLVKFNQPSRKKK